MATVMLIDGNSLTYRAFFALPTDMATASGQVTNAVFGFTSMLINLMKDHEPDHIAVAFDRPEPTFRHEMTPTYKAQREAAPDILRQQMGVVREVLDAMAIPTLEKVGFEADDIIATLATQGRDRGDDVIIVTGDRDSYQLVEDPHVKVLYNKRGVSDYALYDEAGIFERTGVRPVDYVQYAALRGDNSDNLPGVPGVGPKTAAKWINQYGSLEALVADVDAVKGKAGESLRAHLDDVLRTTDTYTTGQRFGVVHQVGMEQPNAHLAVYDCMAESPEAAMADLNARRSERDMSGPLDAANVAMWVVEPLSPRRTKE